MTTQASVRTKVSMALLLACCLLVCAPGSAQAAAKPADIQWVNAVFRVGVLTGTIPPLQAAISESDAIACLNRPNPPSRNDCAVQSIPSGFVALMSPVVMAAQLSQYYLPGAWATRNFYKDSADDGTMIIDKNNVGTYTVGGRTSTLVFSRYEDTDGTIYIVFGYRTTEGDRGSGALQVSGDGCLMYGPYYSASDPKTQGHLLMARC
jgi:hypothetical protein